jgi:hypothetical protein
MTTAAHARASAMQYSRGRRGERTAKPHHVMTAPSGDHMKLQRMFRAWLATALLLATGLAFAAGAKDAVEQGTGIAFGSFDITESDLAVTHVVLMRIKPARMYMGSGGEKATVTYTQGEFYSANLSPGMYSLIGFFSGNKFFALDARPGDKAFTVEAGRATYAGSYKLVLAKGGLFRRDKGTFEPITSYEEEGRLLHWLAQELKGSGWGAIVKARMTETGRK